MLSSMENLVVLSIFGETGWILSEQQKTAVHQKWIWACKYVPKELLMSDKVLYDAKFCVDSKFDIKTRVSHRNQKICYKNVVL